MFTHDSTHTRTHTRTHARTHAPTHTVIEPTASYHDGSEYSIAVKPTSGGNSTSAGGVAGSESVATDAKKSSKCEQHKQMPKVE